MTEIWVVGSTNTNADRSLNWHSLPSNFNDPDIIIMNLNALNQDILRHVNKEKFRKSKNDIFNKFLNGGNFVFLTSPLLGDDDFNNFHLCPIKYSYEENKTKKILYDKKYSFSPYLEKIREVNFIISDFHINDELINIKPTNTISRVIKDIFLKVKDHSIHTNPIKLSREIIATDNSQNVIAARLWLQVNGYWKSGSIIFVPSPNTDDINEVIDILLEISGKTTIGESMPEWVSNINIPKLETIIQEIKSLESNKKTIENEIKKVESRRSEVETYYKLLVAKNSQLENSVYQAFKLMGFNEISKKRENNLEDWVIDFKINCKYIHGLIEVKGSDKRTSQAHLTQCSKWVDEYFNSSIITKGIFIPNQYRQKIYPDSKGERMYFHPNELQYCELRDICIIPTSVIFDAVKEILDGTNIHRETIENLWMEQIFIEKL